MLPPVASVPPVAGFAVLPPVATVPPVLVVRVPPVLTVPPVLLVPPVEVTPPVAVAPPRLVVPPAVVCPPVVAPPEALLEFPPLPPEAAGEPEESQPASSATSRTEASQRGPRSLWDKFRSRRDVKCRSMVTPLKPGGSGCALALPCRCSSRAGHFWPIPRGVQKCIAAIPEDRQLEPASMRAGWRHPSPPRPHQGIAARAE
jgi:hypothetical protein